MKWAASWLVAAAFVALPDNVGAWDHAGHMLVGQVAWEKTNPAARERVAELVRLLPSQHNQNQPYNFVTVGCWMDDMRAEPGYAWAKWHYVTIPWTPDGSQFQIPELPHVAWAIEEMRAKLRDPELKPEQQAQAVAMLIHFVGDLHQPMHATDRGDRGGNGFFIAGLPFSTVAPKKPGTLHFFWDAAFRAGVEEGKAVELWRQPDIAARPKAPDEGVIAAEADKLISEYPTENLSELKETPLKAEAWARESHDLGCRSGYPEGMAPSETELHVLPPEFIVRSQEIAGRRIVLAGNRLAAVLNELFGK